MGDALAAKFGIEVTTGTPLRTTLAEVGAVCLLAVALYFAFRSGSERQVHQPRQGHPRRRQLP
jgi:hypothetical protein